VSLGEWFLTFWRIIMPSSGSSSSRRISETADMWQWLSDSQRQVWEGRGCAGVALKMQLGHLPDQPSTNYYHYTYILPHFSHDSYFSLTAWPLKMKAPWSFETLRTTHPTRQCHILQDLNLQQHYCENLKSRMWNVLLKHCSVIVSEDTNILEDNVSCSFKYS
jgi:hypothetical protein